MAEIQRYSMEMMPYTKGAFVKHKDHQATLATARREERERCEKECLRVWKDEPDTRELNGLSHGCLASAAAIHALGEGK